MEDEHSGGKERRIKTFGFHLNIKEIHNFRRKVAMEIRRKNEEKEL